MLKQLRVLLTQRKLAAQQVGVAQRRGARAASRAKAQPAGRLRAQQRAAARLKPALLRGLVGNEGRLALQGQKQWGSSVTAKLY